MKTLYKKTVLLIIVITLGVGGLRGQGTPVGELPKEKLYTSSTTLTVPPGVTSITIEAWGGGGGGGYSEEDGRACGGGGGGAYAKNVVSVTPGETLIIIVGAGGSGGSSNKDGGNSSVSRPEGDELLVEAVGGKGVYNSENGGEGGKSADCTPKTGAHSGGNGGKGSGTGGRHAAGGGGGGAGSDSDGIDGTGGTRGSTALSNGGTGGVGGDGGTNNPGANKGKGGTGSKNGDTAAGTGAAYSGGGGGGKSTAWGGSNKNGGDGAPGLVRITVTKMSSPIINHVDNDIVDVCQGEAIDILKASWGDYWTPRVSSWEWTPTAGASTPTTTTTPYLNTDGLTAGSYKYKVKAIFSSINWFGETKTNVFGEYASLIGFEVKAIPAVSDQEHNACSGILFTKDIGLSDIKYFWGEPDLEEGLTTQGSTTSGENGAQKITGTLINSTTESKTATYRVTPSNGTCDGEPFNLVVTVAPVPISPDDYVATICSGGSVTYTPTVPEETDYTYSWGVPTVTNKDNEPTEAIEGHSGGSGSSFSTGTLTFTNANTDTPTATVTYSVTPHANGCSGKPFTVTITVQNIPEIIDPGVIESGKDVELELNFPCAGTYSIIGDNDPAIAYITPTGLLYTDTRVENNKPTEHRDGNDEHEGIGGTVTVQFESTNGGCPTTRNITVKPRTKTPKRRWSFAGICPIDEEKATHKANDEIGTPWNFDDPNRSYFANHIVWDSLVIVNHETVWELDNEGDKIPIKDKAGNQLPVLDEDNQQVFDENGDPLMQWEINEVENVKFLKKIKWYADKECTQFVRQGLDPLPIDGDPADKRMESFWQNVTYKPEHNVFWATITDDDDHCESYPYRAVVEIIDIPDKVDVEDFVGYVQPSDTEPLNLGNYLELVLDLDPYQTLYWFNSEEDAALLSNLEDDSEAIEAPELDPTVVGEYTYWLVLSEDEGCNSPPTEYHVQIVDMPQIAFTSQPVMVCPNGRVNMQATITGGTAPYYFEVMNMNRSEVIYALTEETENTLVHGFRANPLATCAYRIFKFKDAYTDAAAKGPYALPVPYETYFDELTLSVIVSEVSEVVPGAGPTSGGTYTEDPENPTDDYGKVTILGSGFMPDGTPTVTEVLFGGLPATGIEVKDNNTLECIPPAHVSGYVTISVENGCTVATLTDGYIYEPLNIIGISPDYGPVTGGTTITIQGTGFMPTETSVVTVSIAGVTAKNISATNGKIVCTTGASDHSMIGSIVINNGTETREFVRRFTYYPVKFVENGQWNEHHKWETQTNDHILPYNGADIEIHANCLQNVNVDMNTITVAPGKAYTLAAGMRLEAEEFTLKANASFLDYNSVTGNMLAKKQNLEHILTQGRNWYVSSPVKESTVAAAFGKDTEGNDLTTDVGNWRVERYNEPDHVWGAIPGKLLAGRGYTAFSANADISVNFSGTYLDGDVNTAFAITRQDDENVKRGFNLVGNPFPSYWRWTAEAAQAANLYSTIWYRTQVAGVYQFWSYNASGNVAAAPGWEDATPTGSYSMAYVAPMQAFWVRMLLNSESSSGTLTFKDSHRSHADHPTNLFRSTRAAATDNAELRPFLRLTVDDGLSIDEAVIYADAEARADFDARDSDKWFTNQGVELFSMPTGSSRALVINSLETIADSTEVLLGFQADEAGAFCLHAKEILNLDTLDVFLVDKWRRQEINLRTHDYNFTSSSVPVTDRFAVVFRASTPTGNDGGIAEEATGTTGNELLAYTNTNKEVVVVLYMPAHQGREKQVEVFDIAGRKITQQPVVVGARTVLGVSFSSGVYLLRAGGCTTKVVVE